MTATLDAAVVLPVPRPTRATRPPRAQVADMARSSDFYLRLGCEVGRAADGWVLMCGEAVSFVLVQAPPHGGTGPPPAVPDPAVPDPRGPDPAVPWLRLVTRDVRALRRRLLSDDVPVGRVCRPDRAPAGEIVVRDPDRRQVAIEQLAPGRTPATDPRVAHVPPGVAAS